MVLSAAFTAFAFTEEHVDVVFNIYVVFIFVDFYNQLREQLVVFFASTKLSYVMNCVGSISSCRDELV